MAKKKTSSDEGEALLREIVVLETQLVGFVGRVSVVEPQFPRLQTDGCDVKTRARALTSLPAGLVTARSRARRGQRLRENMMTRMRMPRRATRYQRVLVVRSPVISSVYPNMVGANCGGAHLCSGPPSCPPLRCLRLSVRLSRRSLVTCWRSASQTPRLSCRRSSLGQPRNCRQAAAFCERERAGGAAGGGGGQDAEGAPSARDSVASRC